MNIDGLTSSEIQEKIESGYRFVYFCCTISLIIVTFRRTSDVYLLRSRKNAPNRVLYTLLSLLFGWWGIPWGPKHTMKAIMTNLRGGKDVTGEVMATVAGYELFEEVNNKR